MRCSLEGVESTKAGTKISGRGKVTSEAGKKALGESMEAMVAEMGKTSADKATKGRGNANTKPKTEKTAAEKEVKELKTTIKAPLGLVLS